MHIFALFFSLSTAYLLPSRFTVRKLLAIPYSFNTDNLFSNKVVIYDYYQELEDQLYLSLDKTISSVSQSRKGNRFSIDLLTPGLNPKLEQKAFLQQEYLFDLVIRVVPLLDMKYRYTQLAFSSIGDAAG